MVAQLESRGIEILSRGIEILGRQDEDYGRFAWIVDPDGVKVELWQQLGPAPD
jgi:predicted enzyme related to lactoylglutathione lyase